MLKKLELSKEMHLELINYSKKKNIQFLSSPFDLDSIELLKDLGLETFKIPSGEITNLPYLRKIGKLNKKIISVTKGWTDAYYNFFMAGEADLVLSYSSSPAAHIMFEENNDISASTFEEGNYISIEFAGI